MAIYLFSCADGMGFFISFFLQWWFSNLIIAPCLLCKVLSQHIIFTSVCLQLHTLSKPLRIYWPQDPKCTGHAEISKDPPLSPKLIVIYFGIGMFLLGLYCMLSPQGCGQSHESYDIHPVAVVHDVPLFREMVLCWPAVWQKIEHLSVPS